MKGRLSSRPFFVPRKWGGYAAYHPEVSSYDGHGMQRSIHMRKPGDGPLTADPVTLLATMKRHQPQDEPLLAD
jgi:hypothetical protein